MELDKQVKYITLSFSYYDVEKCYVECFKVSYYPAEGFKIMFLDYPFEITTDHPSEVNELMVSSQEIVIDWFKIWWEGHNKPNNVIELLKDGKIMTCTREFLEFSVYKQDIRTEPTEEDLDKEKEKITPRVIKVFKDYLNLIRFSQIMK